jgi:peptidoglycan/LPS O-acetylase OafA/YrhL
MHDYRADIDGLRALAILPVLFFHAGFPFARGGYIGVDVFFVVSGFLITRLIQPRIQDGSFSLLDFYERRARRLLPALTVVLLATAIAGAWLLVPSAYRYFGGSLFATSLFGSNVFFWLEAGYFDTASEGKPLLHTWSLAVEEQFYWIFPLLLMLVLRQRRPRPMTWTLAALVGSLVASEWAAQRAVHAAFYLTPFRAWELALGVALALGAQGNAPGRASREALAWLGIALIAGSSVAYSWQTRFPGLHAAVPCLGTALVIWTGSGHDTRLKQLLSFKPLVFVGLLSYSLYLWHWPVLAFARHFAIRELTLPERWYALVASGVLAVASWKFVETPTRRRRALTQRRSMLMAAAGSAAALALVGLMIVAGAGWPARFDAAATAYLASENDRNPRLSCSLLEARDLREGRACRLGAPDSPVEPAFVVWGDSHADALMTAFDELAAKTGASGVYVGKIGCPPLLGVERFDSPYNCEEFGSAAHDLIEHSNATTVLLVARWAHYTREPTIAGEPRTPVVISDGSALSASAADNDAVLTRGLTRTLQSLRGRRVYVVASVPEIGYHVPRSLAMIEHLHRSLDLRPTLKQFEDRQRVVERLFAQLALTEQFQVLRPAQVLCDAQFCRVESDGRALYRDEHHLTTRGAALIEPVLRPAFD